jgi:hypothetical protein
MTRLQELEASAARAGLAVRTYSPGDGKTRYKFFSLPYSGSYFSGHPLDTVIGLAAANKYVSDYKARLDYVAEAAVQSRREDEEMARRPLISASSKPTIADVKRANIEYHRRRGEDFSFFDKKTSRFFGPEKFFGPYSGPGGIFFVNKNKHTINVREVKSTGDIGLPIGDHRFVEDARDAAKALAKGTRSAEKNPRRRARR